MAKKKATRKKVVAKKKATGKATSTARSRGTKPAKKKPAMNARPGRRSRKKAPPQPRPRIPGNADLDLVFKEDYHARQCFAFLRVRSVNDLEKLSPRQINKILSIPFTQTIDRIRRKLAENNRYLAGDEEYFKQFRAGQT